MSSAVLVPSGLVTGSPAAQMSVGETAATAFSPRLIAGIGASVQAVPFQCSIGAVRPGALPPAAPSLRLSPATPPRPPRPVPPGFGPVGIGTEVQAVPSQCTASGTLGSWFCAVAMPPTAQASLAATALTPVSVSFRNLATGTGVDAHAVPSQCSARPPLASALPISPTWPTAQASVAVRPNTPFSLSSAGLGFGLGVTANFVAAAAGGPAAMPTAARPATATAAASFPPM